jgi:hypothetical protein
VGSSACAEGRSCAAKYQTIPPMPANRRTKLMTLQTTVLPVGVLPTRGSCGQLLVYVTAWPGRFVVAAQAVHQKKALIARALTASVSAPRGIAYASRPCENTSA